MKNTVYCIYCKKEYSTKGIHTHYYRTHCDNEAIKNKFSNGNNGKYKQIAKILKSKHKEKLKEEKIIYNKNPKICIKCNNSISFEKRKNVFCCRKCANARIMDSNAKNKISSGIKNSLPSKIEGMKRRNHTRITYTMHKQKCVICNMFFWNKNKRKTCSFNCNRKALSIKSSANINCGGKRNSKNCIFQNIIGNSYNLESTYELRFAKRLNDLGLLWIRPSPIKYIDITGKQRRYHPDFYVESLNLYFDPKNDYLIEIDSEKISLVEQQNKIKILIIPNDQIDDWHPRSQLS